MASLLVAGAVSGLGKGMVAKAEEDYKTIAADADRAHDLQMENMRQKNLREMQNRRLEADDRRDKSRAESEAIQQDVQIKFQGEQGEAERKAGRESDLLKAQTDIYTTAMKQYFQRSSKGSARGGGWESKFIEHDPVFDMETGETIQQPPTVFVRDETSGRNYYQVGDKLIEANQESEPRKFASPDIQRQAEAPLLSGEITAETFKDEHGYLPTEYVFGKIAKGNKGFAGVWEEVSRMPAFALGQAGDTGNVPAAVGGGGKGALSIAAEQAGEVPPAAAEVQPENLEQGGQLEPPMSEVQVSARQPAPSPRPRSATQQMYDQSGVAKGVVEGVRRIGNMPPAQAPRRTRAGSQQ